MRVIKSGDRTTVEIYFSDLTEEAQKALLLAHNTKSPEEMNWDVFPIFVEEVERRIVREFP